AEGSRAGTRRPREKCYATEAKEGYSMQLLRLQAITRSRAIQAGSGLKSLDMGAAAPSMIKLIREAQRIDAYCQAVFEALQPSQGQDNPPHPQRQSRGVFAAAENTLLWALNAEGDLTYGGQLYVPAQLALRQELLRRFHDCPTAGHWGVARTKELLQRHFNWKGLHRDVQEYVATCPQCQGKAIHRHKPYGKLEPLPLPKDVKPFQHLSLDWITGLPESRKTSTGQSFNSILTIVDRFTKYAYFVPTTTDTTAANFAELFFETVECHHGTPLSIVTDRDSRITAQFWQEVCAYKSIKRRLSTAYHPQTDGQSEALNRIVEDYLRAYSTDDQASWVNLLPLAQFAYNNSTNHTTGKSPHYILYGFNCDIRFHVEDNALERGIDRGLNPRHPKTGRLSMPNLAMPGVEERIQRLHQLRTDLQTKLDQARKRMAKYYDQNHTPKEFKQGSLVKLSTKNLRLVNRKLAPRWIGPFRITGRIGGQAYRLALPAKYSRLHDVFPVQALEDYHRRGNEEPMPMPDLEDLEDEYEVEEIKDQADLDGIRHYLVKWAGWPAEYNTWEPEANLENAPKALQSFKRSRKRRRRD
ncbi:hypothetical protein V502_10100, partial [Pseudogymnoascus sp. VKM F-4520 (FW-2644)]